MSYKIHLISRWLMPKKYCGEFKTLGLAIDRVNYLQEKLPKGKKIGFRITCAPQLN